MRIGPLQTFHQEKAKSYQIQNKNKSANVNTVIVKTSIRAVRRA